jgi:hypothetical protein
VARSNRHVEGQTDTRSPASVIFKNYSKIMQLLDEAGDWPAPDCFPQRFAADAGQRRAD